MFHVSRFIELKYIYRARTREGKVETGTIEAYSKEAAASILQKYNIFVTSLEERRTKEPFFRKIEFNKNVSRKELAIFFRQLSTMLESRVPVIQSLTTLAAQTRKISFRKVMVKISSLVEEGLPLSEALATYPQIFDNFYISLIKSGEVSGKVPSILYYVSEHLEKESDIIAQVRQAMIYPIFVISVFFAVIAVIITQLVPQITKLIQETGVEPSLFTTAVLSFYEFLSEYWWILIMGLFLLVIFIIYYFHTKEGKKNYDKISLKTPFVGEFLKKVFLVRFCSNIFTLLIAGISINRAIEITEDTVNNIVYKGIISEIGQRVSEGEKISSAMIKHQDYFPPFVVQMVKVGEETGKLDKVLIEVVGFYQKETKKTIDLFSTLLEPIIIIFLGIVVTMLAISVFSSLYGIVGKI